MNCRLALIDFYNDNKIIMENYTEELTSLVDPHIDTGDVILDVGSGELTTITSIVNKLSRPFQRLYTLDMSIQANNGKGLRQI